MLVEHYGLGQITVGGRTYTADVIIWPEGVDDTWWRAEGNAMGPDDVDAILNKQPDVVIVGTGETGQLDVPSDVLAALQQGCSRVHVEPTQRACELYNELAGGPQRVVAALHLTR